jgi:hypothetical protein
VSMKSLMVTFKGDEYVVEYLAHPSTTRYFTDTTLPDEIKYKLGLLMFGVKDSTVGWRGGFQSDWMLDDPNTPRSYVVRVSEDTYEHVIGRIRHDTRSQGESQGQKDS